METSYLIKEQYERDLQARKALQNAVTDSEQVYKSINTSKYTSIPVIKFPRWILKW